jgi:hypothetical protein
MYNNNNKLIMKIKVMCVNNGVIIMCIINVVLCMCNVCVCNVVIMCV